VRARNSTGSTILNGAVVYISGAQGQNPRISLAQANAESTSRVIGVATHNISNNTVGKVCTFGIVGDLNTSAYNEGDVLYLSTSVAGGLTTTRPSAPNQAVMVGTVVHAAVNDGKILVHPDNYGIGYGTADQFLKMNSAGTGQEYVTLQTADLSDYEEGSFTPELTFGGLSTGITYATRYGYYTKIGDIVICQIDFLLTSKGSATGQAGLSLPFTGNPLVQQYNAAFADGSFNNIKVIFSRVVASVAGMAFYSQGDNGSNFALFDTDFTNTSRLTFTVIYKV
jgi:hypothetical protein